MTAKKTQRHDANHDGHANKKAPAADTSQPAKTLPALPKAPKAADDGSAWMGAVAAANGAFDQMRKNPRPALVYVGLILLGGICDHFLWAHRVQPDVLTAAAVLQSFRETSLQSIAQFALMLALPTYGLALADRKMLSVRDFLGVDDRRVFFKFVSIFVGYVLFFALAILSGILLLIPLIWIIPWFSMLALVVAEHGFGPIAAMKESKRLARDYKSYVWGVLFLSFVLGIAGGIISALLLFVPMAGIIIGSIVSVVSVGMLATLYRWLQDVDKADDADHAKSVESVL